MMNDNVKINVRRANERGHANHGWLNSYHTFSFADYHDPKHMGFRTLRVINDDTVDPSMGFGSHPHRDMEIISFVIEGELEHKDSMGNGSVIEKGSIQKITAGSGIVHSEFNPSEKEPVHFLQIWIKPDKQGLNPDYQQIHLNDVEPAQGLRLIASKTGESNSVQINQDARMYHGQLDQGERAVYKTDKTRGLWVQVIEGAVCVTEKELAAGDGLSVENADQITIDAKGPASFLLFDLN